MVTPMPALSRTYYDMLGIPRKADEVQIKSAYRVMAKKWHPDVCKEPHAEMMFKDIQSAYAILGDRNKRREYDLELRAKEGDAKPDFDSLMGVSFASPVAERAKPKRRTTAQPRRRRRRGKAALEEIPEGFDEDETLGGII